MCLAGIYSCILVYLTCSGCISRAINIAKQAARFIGHRPWLPLFPILQSIGLLCFMLPWIYFGAYLGSSGELKSIPTPSGVPLRKFVYATNVRNALIYYLFMYFWTSEFICAVGQIVNAVCVSRWYFNDDALESTDHKDFFNKKIDARGKMVLSAVRVSLWNHAGTAAFGGLLIAIVKMIRAALMYLQKKMKDKGKAIQMILCCLQCITWCLQKCFEFLNKNAYIQTAITSKSFCPAAKDAFFLILHNAGDIMAVGVVASTIEYVIKFVISFLTAMIAYARFESHEGIHGPFFPSFLTGLLAFGVSIMFSQVFDMAISTILHCMVYDKKEYGDGKAPQFADSQLTKWKQNSTKASDNALTPVPTTPSPANVDV